MKEKTNNLNRFISETFCFSVGLCHRLLSLSSRIVDGRVLLVNFFRFIAQSKDNSKARVDGSSGKKTLFETCFFLSLLLYFSS